VSHLQVVFPKRLSMSVNFPESFTAGKKKSKMLSEGHQVASTNVEKEGKIH